MNYWVVCSLWLFSGEENNVFPCSAASLWRQSDVSVRDVISHTLVDSASSNTVWFNSCPGQNRILSSIKCGRLDHMCAHLWRHFSFIFWFGWVIKQEPLRPLFVPNIPLNRPSHIHSPLKEAEKQEAEESRSRTRVSMVPSLSWQKEKSEKLKIGGWSCTEGSQRRINVS